MAPGQEKGQFGRCIAVKLALHWLPQPQFCHVRLCWTMLGSNCLQLFQSANYFIQRALEKSCHYEPLTIWRLAEVDETLG